MKSNLIILGSDTDAGKTTFALLWLSAFADRYAYWKPIETGPSDSDTVRRLVPDAMVYPPAQRFAQPVAPPLAARQQGESVWSAERLAAALPAPHSKSLLMETFGSPFSPLNDDELQIELIRRLDATSILISSSALGAIGRTLQTLEGLQGRGVLPRAVVLVGPVDDFAIEARRKHRPHVPAFSLQSPAAWSVDGVRKAAADQRATLETMRTALSAPSLPQNADEKQNTEVARLLDRDSRFIWHPYTSLRDPTPPL